jgi:hypothetical protein
MEYLRKGINRWSIDIYPKYALEIYSNAELLQRKALSRFLFLMFAYTPSNKNLARAHFIIGFRHFITIPNPYFGMKL